MADKNADGIMIEIETESGKADKSLNKTMDILKKIADVAKSIDTDKFSAIADCFKQFSAAGSQLDSAAAGAKELSKSLKSLCKVDTDKIKEIADSVSQIGGAFGNLGSNNNVSIHIDASGIRKNIEPATSAMGDMAKTESEVANIAKQAAKAQDNLNDSVEKTNSSNAQVAIKQLVETINQYKAAVRGMENGKIAFDDTQYKESLKGLQKLQQQFNEYKSNILKSTPSVKGTVLKALQDIANGTGKVGRTIKSFAQGIKNAISGISKRFTKSLKTSTKAANESFKTLKKKIGSITRLFTFMLLRSAFTHLFGLTKTGFNNLIIYSNRFGTEFHKNVNLLYNDLKWVGNSFATAFEPVLNYVTPILDTLITYLVAASNALAQFFAALTGKNTYTKAIKQTQDYAQALDDASNSMKKQLADFDELHSLTKNTSASDALNGNASNMFTTEEVESVYSELADNAKSIMSDLFEPLKTSWDETGRYVMDSWKYAVKEIAALMKSIGSDFLEVWNEPKTLDVLNEMSHIVGDIGTAAGNLARNFRAACDENETGKQILENIRDIIGTIVGNIHEAAEATVAWSDKLDFSTLLQKINEWTASLIPVFENLSGVLSDFYKMVLLPLAQWTIEKGLPELVQVFIDFNDKVNWEELRTKLQTLWEKIEPFCETVGEGLVIFIGDVSTAIANFANSDVFQGFLDKLGTWMDEQEPQDIADGLKAIAAAIITLKVALVAFKAVKTITTIFTAVKNFLGLFGVGKGTAMATEMTAAAGGITALKLALEVGLVGIAASLAALAGYLGGSTLSAMIAEWSGDEELMDAATMPFTEKMATIKESFTDGTWKDALKLWGQDISDGFSAMGESIGEWWNNITGKNSEETSKIAGDNEELVLSFDKARESISSTTRTTQTLDAGLDNVNVSTSTLKTGLGSISKVTSDTASATRQFADSSDAATGALKNTTTQLEATSNSTTLFGQNLSNMTSATKENTDNTTSAFSTMKDNISSITDNISASAREKWTSIKETTSNITTSLKDSVGNIVNTLKTNLGTSWNAIKSSVSTIATSLKTNVANTWTALKTSVTNTVTSLKTSVTNIWSTIKGSVSNTVNTIKSTISNVWNGIKSTTDNVFGNIKNSISDKINGAKNAVSTAISSMKSAFNFSWSLPNLKLPHISISGSFSLNPISVPSFNISWYKEGGFLPDSYSLIGAGENGIPEMLGTVGGKSAVAGGEEITGIRDAVYDTAQQQIQLLQQQNQLLQGILQKEFGITQTDVGKAARSYAKEYFARTGNNAYSY